MFNDKYKLYNLEKRNYNINRTSLDNINEPDNTRYVLFTSSTTGKPKGTLASHFNI